MWYLRLQFVTRNASVIGYRGISVGNPFVSPAMKYEVGSCFPMLWTSCNVVVKLEIVFSNAEFCNVFSNTHHARCGSPTLYSCPELHHGTSTPGLYTFKMSDLSGFDGRFKQFRGNYSFYDSYITFDSCLVCALTCVSASGSIHTLQKLFQIFKPLLNL